MRGFAALSIFGRKYKQAPRERQQTPEEELDDRPYCPKCVSRHKPIEVTTMSDEIPQWLCGACGHNWQDGEEWPDSDDLSAESAD